MLISEYVATLHELMATTSFVTGTTFSSYDNANDPAARNLPTFPHHKHDPSGILPATQPSLARVLQEILSQLRLPDVQ